MLRDACKPILQYSRLFPQMEGSLQVYGTTSNTYLHVLQPLRFFGFQALWRTLPLGSAIASFQVCRTGEDVLYEQTNEGGVELTGTL